MSHWLTNLSLDHQAAMSYLGVLRLLTEDLDAMSGSIKRQYPMFHRVVIKSSSTLAKDSTSRRVYLQRYCSPNLIEEVMTCWKRSLRFMVPSPKSTKKGDYSNHVNWMGALQELDVLEYNLLLSEWRKTHGRRRNLWRDMRKAGLG